MIERLRRAWAAFGSPPRQTALRLVVDVPEAEASSSGTMVIQGWAFSGPGLGVEVSARLGVGAPIVLALGVRRSDVARAFSRPDVERCGFDAVLTFEPKTPGPEVLTVRATDERGEVAEIVVPIRIVRRLRRRSSGASTWEPAARVLAESGVPEIRPGLRLQLEATVADARDRIGREPSVLDWESGVQAAVRLPQVSVTSPPIAGAPVLPYLDQTFDLVVVNGLESHRTAEARRVARSAVAQVRLPDRLSVTWQPGAPAPPVAPAVSIVIPVYNQTTMTEACVTQVIDTLPPDFVGEIVIVDDASAEDTARALERLRGECPLIRVVQNDTNQGFLRSCNLGAQEATGEILVFLNNDTLPQPGWLQPLVRHFVDEPKTGVAGAKLLYPDGALQEAGGVVFSDASGCNFGRRDPNPGSPLYAFVREVDYCSGAALAIRRALFEQLRGFDEYFAPAYYEDTDLCFRVREMGYRVCYEPDSVVIHVEGATSGIDPDAGVKRFQAINRGKFLERWRAQLATHPPPPETMDVAARFALLVRDSRRRVLVAAPRLPEYDRESGSRRVFDQVELFLRDGWAVSVVALDSSGGDRYIRRLQRMGVAVYAGPGPADDNDDESEDAAFLADVDTLITHGRFDLAVLAFWTTAECLLPRVRLLSPSTRVVVDSIDLHFLREARQRLRAGAPTSDAGLDADYADRMIREVNTYATADSVLTVSRKEADLVNDLTGRPSLADVLPDLEEIAISPFGASGRCGLLFVGNFRHAPNVEALKYLCDEVLPLVDPVVLARHPLQIVGYAVDQRVLALAHGRACVHVVGWVPELRPYLERARVSVVPLRHGAGTKRKLIQALMTGTPSVSSPVGAEGLGLEHGVHVLIADAADAFARQIERLLTDDMLWGELAARGRAHALSGHGREAVRARWRSVVHGVTRSPDPLPTGPRRD